MEKETKSVETTTTSGIDYERLYHYKDEQCDELKKEMDTLKRVVAYLITEVEKYKNL